jgi:hypothetical protein
MFRSTILSPFPCHPDATMTPTSIPGFLTKKEVEERYGRSHRSLTRDFSAAVRRADPKVLPHLKIQTEDGTVRLGPDVTLEQIQKWSNQGLSPTWYVESEWAAERYGVRSTPNPQRPSARTGEAPADLHQPTTARPDSSELLRRMEQQIQDLQHDKEQLYRELGIKNEQIQQANDRTRESNVLMKQLQTLLGNVQERVLLPLPSQPTPDTVATVTEADIKDDESSTTPITRQATKVSSTKPRPRSEKGSSGQKSNPAPTPTKSPTADKHPRPKWYETPTLDRIFRRRS